MVEPAKAKEPDGLGVNRTLPHAIYLVSKKKIAQLL